MYKKIYFSLEINDHIMILVAQNNENEKTNVVGYYSLPTKGFKNNVVVNQNDFVAQLKKLILQFENKYLIKVENIAVVINSKNINTAIRTKTIKLEKNKPISNVEIKLALDSLKSVITTEVKHVTCALPLVYKLDGDKIVSPFGLVGKILEIKTLLISSPSNELYSLLYAIELCGLTIIDIAPSFIANVFYSFDHEDNRKRIMLFDFGFNSTQVIHFDSGVVQNVFNLDFGVLSFKAELENVFGIKDKSFAKIFEIIYKTKISELDQKISLKTKDGQLKEFKLDVLKAHLNNIVAQTLVFIKGEILESVIDFSEAIFSNVIADFENIYDLSLVNLNRETKVIRNMIYNFEDSYYTNVMGLNYYIQYMEDLVGLKITNSHLEQLKYQQNTSKSDFKTELTQNTTIKQKQSENKVEELDQFEEEYEEYEVIEKTESKVKNWWTNFKNKIFDNKGEESYDE